MLESLFRSLFGVLKAFNFIKKRLQHKGFSVNIANFLALSPRALFLNFRKKTGNYAVLACCAAANYYSKAAKICLILLKI